MHDTTQAKDDDAPYFHYSATLRIFGVIPDFNAISTTLGLQPTYWHRRGEQRGPRSTPYKFDMWSYDAPVPEARPLDVHLETLWAHIKDQKVYLKQLKRTLTVDVFCGYRSSSGTAGFEVGYSALELFIELEIPFGVSVIIA
jgi:hypothetical protein